MRMAGKRKCRWRIFCLERLAIAPGCCPALVGIPCIDQGIVISRHKGDFPIKTENRYINGFTLVGILNELDNLPVSCLDQLFYILVVANVMSRCRKSKQE